MSDDYRQDWLEIVRLSKLDDTESIHKLTRYVMEGSRIVSAAPGVLRACAKDIVVADGERKVSCTDGDQVFIDLVSSMNLVF